LGTVAGCSSKKATTSTPKQLDKVSYLTGIGTFGRESYPYVGKEKGFFRDAGIDLDIKPGAAGNNNQKLLAAGQVQFAAIDFTGGIIDAGNGNFKDWRAILAVQQRTLLSLLTTDKSGITSPKDLEGKNVVETTGSVFGKLFPTYAKLAGFDDKKVHWSGAQTAQLPSLLVSGKADAIGLFVAGAPAVQLALGPTKKVVTLAWDQYITDLYGNAIITTPKLLQSNPDLVKRFRSALLKSLDYTINHPDEAGEIIHKVQASLDVKESAEEVRLMTPYVRGGASIGVFDQARVARAIAIMQGAGTIPAGLTPDQVVDWSVAA
jgi:NitT/TauT family transport system substrate-binding protein